MASAQVGKKVAGPKKASKKALVFTIDCTKVGASQQQTRLFSALAPARTIHLLPPGPPLGFMFSLTLILVLSAPLLSHCDCMTALITASD